MSTSVGDRVSIAMRPSNDDIPSESMPQIDKMDADGYAAASNQPCAPYKLRSNEAKYSTVDDIHPQGSPGRTASQLPSWDDLFGMILHAGGLKTGQIPCSFWSLTPTHEKAILQFFNSDEGTYELNEWNLATGKPATHKTFMHTTTSPSEVVWLDEDNVLLLSTFSGASQTQAGEASTVRMWKRDDNAEDAAVVFTVSSEHYKVKAFRDWGAEREVVVYIDAETPVTNTIYVGNRSGIQSVVPFPKTASWGLCGNHAVLVLKEDWSVGGREFEVGHILGLTGSDTRVLCKADGFVDASLDTQHLAVLFDHGGEFSVRVFRPADGWSEQHSEGQDRCMLSDVVEDLFA